MFKKIRYALPSFEEIKSWISSKYKFIDNVSSNRSTFILEKMLVCLIYSIFLLLNVMVFKTYNKIISFLIFIFWNIIFFVYLFIVEINKLPKKEYSFYSIEDDQIF
ncbi:MAG: hypothetical protein AD073_000227 [Mycoplasmataceae bacterium]|nr:MAG: hypothetical protein AD073_000227 [Mycoplasmataceae bacterium]